MRVFINIVVMALVVASLCFAFAGIEQLYNDDRERQVVGGDAYNFIIYATRGTAYVGVGIIFAVLANLAAGLRK